MENAKKEMAQKQEIMLQMLMRGRNKSPFLHDLATSRNCIWLAVTETWLHSGILDSEMLEEMLLSL